MLNDPHRFFPSLPLPGRNRNMVDDTKKSKRNKIIKAKSRGIRSALLEKRLDTEGERFRTDTNEGDESRFGPWHYGKYHGREAEKWKEKARG